MRFLSYNASPLFVLLWKFVFRWSAVEVVRFLENHDIFAKDERFKPSACQKGFKCCFKCSLFRIRRRFWGFRENFELVLPGCPVLCRVMVYSVLITNTITLILCPRSGWFRPLWKRYGTCHQFFIFICLTNDCSIIGRPYRISMKFVHIKCH